MNRELFRGSRRGGRAGRGTPPLRRTAVPVTGDTGTAVGKLQRGLDDNSGTRYATLAPVDRFIETDMGTRVLVFNRSDPVDLVVVFRLTQAQSYGDDSCLRAQKSSSCDTANPSTSPLLSENRSGD